MANLDTHPCFRAIQQSIESITQRAVYNEIKDKLLAEEVITWEDIDECDKLTNLEAVRRITRKVVHSISGCEKFLKVLDEMSQPQYKELLEIITERCKQNTIKGRSHMIQYQNLASAAQETKSCNEEQVGDQFNTIPQEQAGDPIRTISEEQVHEMLQEGHAIADTLLKQEVEMISIVEAMRAEKIAGKSFTEFLMHIVKLFRKAIEKGIIYLKKSARQPFVQRLNEYFLILKNIHEDFCSPGEDTTPPNDSIAIIVIQAKNILAVIKSIQKTYWLRLS